MFKKIGNILLNFFKTSKIKEIIEIMLIPAIIVLALYLFCNNKICNFKNFIIGFNDTVITLTSLLSAFGLATLSILVTSSSDNVRMAKEKLTQRTDRRHMRISYYKLLVIRSFFSLLLQLGLLLMSVINKFIMEVNQNNIIFYIQVYILFVALFTQIFVVNSMYYLLATPKLNNSEPDDK